MPSHQTAFGQIGVSRMSYFLLDSLFSSIFNLPSLISSQTLLRSLPGKQMTHSFPKNAYIHCFPSLTPKRCPL